MRDEYELETMEPRPNPYASKLKKQITIRLGEDVIGYFKQLAEETGMPYQNLIDLYLRDCMASGRKLSLTWEERP
jgi:predicted DNA binding CopG/RHH family protein